MFTAEEIRRIKPSWCCDECGGLRSYTSEECKKAASCPVICDGDPASCMCDHHMVCESGADESDNSEASAPPVRKRRRINGSSSKDTAG